MVNYSYLDDNFAAVREEIRAAAEKAGRSAEEITLVAVTKTVDADVINYVHDNLGVNVIGENRVQSLLEKYDKLHRDGLKIHFIGSLQTNKVKYIIDKVDLIQSLDNLRLAKEIDKQAKKVGRVMDVLIEINSAREENKGGIMPEEAETFLDEVLKFENIRVIGVMTIGPVCEDIRDLKKFFEETYRTFIDFSTKKLHNIDSPILSMGMSRGFEYAIETGSTMVRIGNALFRPGSNK
ncbi:MAG: YggS family pyridoxal phosphate-dependent enzyme [Clostridia bacterium]|nr:YggS family pyridoxal phosphate-dependent enzyme [Clostridia bacterium]